MFTIEKIMRRVFPSVGAVFFGLALVQLPAHAQTPAAETTNAQARVGYAIGMSVGINISNDLHRVGFKVDYDDLMRGFKDALTGQKLELTLQEAQQAIKAYSTQRQHELYEKNVKEGEAFLAENKSKEGVKTQEVTLPGGKTAEFQYKVITEGTGDTPKSNDVVQVNYRGTLIDGTEFDSSARHGPGPTTLRVNQIPRGWSEALQMMKVGSKWDIYIPASLAYGERSVGIIQPGSTVIREVELVGIGAPHPAAPAQPVTSDIVKVPSLEEQKKGAKIEMIPAAEAEKAAQAEAAKEQKK